MINPRTFSDKSGVLEFFHSKGILVSPEALEVILERGMGSLVTRLLSNEILSAGYISENDVIKLIRGEIRNEPEIKEINFDEVRTGSSIDDFQKLFRSRYDKLKKIIVTSSKLRSCSDIRNAKKSGGFVKIVGMVTDVSETKNGHKRLILEDLDESIEAIIMKDNPVKKELILNDEVIGVMGSVSKTGEKPAIFVKEIIRPDIPIRTISDSGKEPVYLASISDIHVGSKTFLKDGFGKMVNWMKSSEDEAQRLKYLVLSGDVIDGIGVYPGQDHDLEFLNPIDQYSVLSDYLREIPEDIEVYVMPGNHDTVRLAEPQPLFSKGVRDLFPKNIKFLPNPYSMILEDKRIMVYHGMSLNDMVELVPGANFSSIGGAIEAILQRRHLSPVYGGKTPIIPSGTDYHVIEEVPDIFITGHIHSHYLGNYNGVRYVNSSTWQSQTEYQKMMNFAPDPCILTMFDLNSQSVVKKKFI
ncbi:MAG: DNA-directed DNA polymerase II small subunit [Thermoplasmataceae archaeon]